LNVNLDEIGSILTLRYYPHGSTTLPKLEWKDFIEYYGTEKSIQPLLEGSIKKIIQENKPRKVGVGISGGVDSTTILALTRKCFPKLEIKTFCVTFGEDVREAKDAEYASELYSTDHKHINVENPFSDLNEQIGIVDEPKWNLYPYYLFGEASKSCDLLLTGDGGDELFGGYTFRYKYVLKTRAKPIARRYIEAHDRDWVPDQEKLFAFPFDWNEIYSKLSKYFSNSLPTLGKIFLADYNGKLLYDFAPTNLALSKHFKIKVVAPMLEPEVLYVASHIPYRLKYDVKNDIGKIVLRQILIENFGYKPASKMKIGWGMNIIEMWDKHVREMCESLFEDARFIELGIINKDWLPEGFSKANEHDSRYVSKMFGLLALELWLRKKAS